MQIQLGEVESAGGYRLQEIRIINHEGLLVTTIKVKLFDKTSEQLAPPLELELTIEPQKRVFEAFDRKDHLYVAIDGVK